MRTFIDLRKYKGGKELERWEYDQRAKGIKPIAVESIGEQARIPGTETLSPRPPRNLKPKKKKR